MSDEDALLTAIAAHPDEDTPRLVYADWLDEHDQPLHAEFIRIQIEIARKEHLPRAVLNRYVDLFKRNQELLDSDDGELLGPLAGLPDEARIEFHRGFVSRVELPVGQFLSHATSLTHLRPLPAVRVTDVAARVMDFIRCPDLSVVTELSAFGRSRTDDLRRPDEVDIRDAANRLTRLAVLDLEGCGLGDWVSDFLANGQLPVLTELDLSGNALTDAGVENLLRTHFPCQLKRLVLGGNRISDVGAIALAQRWPTGANDKLENLNLRFTYIGQAGQRALLARFGGRVDLF
jgi:uncharacterized protein (TIGR02996 family)